jgi:hypothetical protein
MRESKYRLFKIENPNEVLIENSVSVDGMRLIFPNGKERVICLLSSVFTDLGDSVLEIMRTPEIPVDRKTHLVDLNSLPTKKHTVTIYLKHTKDGAGIYSSDTSKRTGFPTALEQVEGYLAEVMSWTKIEPSRISSFYRFFLGGDRNDLGTVITILSSLDEEVTVGFEEFKLHITAVMEDLNHDYWYVERWINK